MMTDPPTDDTEAREPDAPDPTDAKHHAPLHVSTATPRRRAFRQGTLRHPRTVVVVDQPGPQSPDVAAGASVASAVFLHLHSFFRLG
eukprot:scaffold204_cov113-Isochrysis_galbana.AAC.3